ncbi:TPA: hypothetical protein ACHGD4_000006 [Escherichia coli]|nr:hypothetical protein [Escherichia coli O146]
MKKINKHHKKRHTGKHQPAYWREEEDKKVRMFMVNGFAYFCMRKVFIFSAFEATSIEEAQEKAAAYAKDKGYYQFTVISAWETDRVNFPEIMHF